jgi:hypothetical protein
MNKLFALALSLLLALWATPLAAHDFWIVPSSFQPAPGSALAVRLKVGERLQGDPVPRDPWQVERFVLRSASGEKKVEGPPGAEPAGFVRTAQEDSGLAWLVYHSRGTRLDLPAAEFEKALRLEGLERIVELRRKNGESAKPSKEVFSRSAKALLKLGEGAGNLWSQPVGLPLELVPEKNPLSPAGPLPLRLLYEGPPDAARDRLLVDQGGPHGAGPGGNRGRLGEPLGLIDVRDPGAPVRSLRIPEIPARIWAPS